MTCMDCNGTGELELGTPGCGCLNHVMSAECTCLCPHDAVECAFCDGTGQVAAPPLEPAGRLR